MKKIIRHLRKQPEETRMSIFYIGMLLSAVLLLGIWAHNFGVNIAKPKIQKSNELSPLSVLKESAVEGFKSVKESAPKW